MALSASSDRRAIEENKEFYLRR